MTSELVKASRQKRRLAHIKIDEGFLADIRDHIVRNGELPRKTLAELAALKSQIQAAIVERQAAKATLEETVDTLQALRIQLQADYDAATTPAQRQAIRAQADAAKAQYDQAVLNLQLANQTLTSLVASAQDALIEERYTKNELTANDLPILAQKKAAYTANIEEKRAALRAKKLLDDPRAAERLANRQLKLSLSRKEADAIAEAEERERNKDRPFP